MKKLLNTLYINTQDTYLHKERETLVIKQGDTKLGQFPALMLKGVCCFGRVSVSPYLMGYLAEQGIELSFFNEQGRFMVRVQGPETGNVLLRREHYRAADDEDRAVVIARLMIAAKVANARTCLQRDLRNHGENAALSGAVKAHAAGLRHIEVVKNRAELLGVEGSCAAAYFEVMSQRLRNPKFTFSNRSRRPPTDPINALLSFCYSMITQECVSALQGVGLDPYVGFMHRERPGRPSLALDLLEEFRAGWADRLVLTLVNRQQLKLKDFVTEASGAVRLSDAGRKTFFTGYQEKKLEQVTHPYLGEQIAIGLLPHAQAQLLARHLRGDTEFYTPWVIK